MFLLYSYSGYLPYPVYDPIGGADSNPAAASISPASAEDLVLLDAYSRAVIGAVDRVGPAVLHLRISGVKDGSGAAGSGVVFTPDAYVLTNSHVVNGARKIQATFPDAACAAGLLTGDVIVAVDGFAVGDVDELHRFMTEERGGKPVPITVLRLTQKLDITVTPRESALRATA